MQRDYNTDAAYFAWEILEFVPVADLAAREKYWCDFYHTFDHARGYNHQPIYNRAYVKNIHKFDGNN